VLESLADEAAATDTPPVVTVADPTALAMAQDVLRRAYAHQGNEAGYKGRMVRYIAASPLPYAAGAMEVLSNEEISANVMAGVFGSESAFIAEAGSRQGLVQVAGAADIAPLAVLCPSVNHLLIGEELFAAGGYMGEQPARIGSLRAQDWIRLLVIAAIFIGLLVRLMTSF